MYRFKDSPKLLQPYIVTFTSFADQDVCILYGQAFVKITSDYRDCNNTCLLKI